VVVVRRSAVRLPGAAKDWRSTLAGLSPRQLDRETLGRVGLLAETIFTTALRTLADQAQQPAGNAWLRHAALGAGQAAA
jgi:hypothetical protein